jgi:hypothetical protein
MLEPTLKSYLALICAVIVAVFTRESRYQSMIVIERQLGRERETVCSRHTLLHKA